MVILNMAGHLLVCLCPEGTLFTLEGVGLHVLPQRIRTVKNKLAYLAGVPFLGRFGLWLTTWASPGVPLAFVLYKSI